MVKPANKMSDVDLCCEIANALYTDCRYSVADGNLVCIRIGGSWIYSPNQAKDTWFFSGEPYQDYIPKEYLGQWEDISKILPVDTPRHRAEALLVMLRMCDPDDTGDTDGVL
jgi:hypothetical protein